MARENFVDYEDSAGIEVGKTAEDKHLLTGIEGRIHIRQCGCRLARAMCLPSLSATGSRS